MNEETLYNLALNEAKQKKREVELEVSDILKKKDKEQEEYKRIQQARITEEIKLEAMRQEAEILSTTLKERNDLLNTSIRQLDSTIILKTKEINDLDIQIIKKQDINSTVKNKEDKLSFIEKTIRDRSILYDDLLKNIYTLVQEEEGIKKEKETLKGALKEKEIYLDEKERYLEQKQASLEHRGKNLTIKEKRLSDLKNKLLKKGEQQQ